MFLSVCGNRFWRFGEWVGKEGGKEGQEKRKRAAGGARQGERGFSCRFREIDFLNIPAKWYQPDATARDSLSGLIAGFW